MNTHDVLHASISAALTQANLSFSTVAGKMGGEYVRLYQMAFASSAGRPCEVAGYVSGNFLVALTPVRIEDAARRREVAESLAQRMPMARIQPSPSDVADQTVAWIEASVPVPGGGEEPAPPWLVVMPFMVVAGAVEVALKTFADLVSLAPHQQSIPMISTTATPAVAQDSAKVTLKPGASDTIRMGPLNSGGRATLVSDDGTLADLNVESFQLGNLDLVVGGVVPASTFPNGAPVEPGAVLTVRLHNQGSSEKRVLLRVE